MIVDLIRHGAPKADGLLLGRTDVGVSDAAWPQLLRQTDGRVVRRVVASPLARSRELAERLAAARGAPLAVDPDWAELDFGDWDGRPVAELRADTDIAARLDAIYADADAPGAPNGETWRGLEMRVKRGLERLVAEDATQDAVVIAHGGSMRVALSLVCGIPFVATWAFRIGYGTRVTLRIGRGDGGRMWGEIVEVVQP